MADSRSRLALDRRTVLAGGAAVMAGLAGCGGDDGQRGEPGKPVEYVPASASVVVGADMALTDSEETLRLLEAYADEKDLLERFEERTGVAPDRVNRVLTFAEEPRSGERTFVVDADVDESEARKAVEERTNAEYEKAGFENGTLYVPKSGDGPAVGTVAKGQYVVGQRSSVETALNVFQGDADGLGDPLRSAYEDAHRGQGGGTGGGGGSGGGSQNGTGNDTGASTQNGTDGGTQNGSSDGGSGQAGGLTQYVTAATDSPREYLPADDSEQVPGGVSLDLYEELETATATYAAGGGEVAIEVDLRAPDAEVAKRVEEFTRTILMYLRSKVSPEVGAQIARIRMERSESVVTVSYRSPVEDAVTLVEWVSQMTAQ